MLLKLCNRIKETNRNIKVDILAMLFGIGTWIGVNSQFLQLPLLVQTAPEGWNLPSYIIICGQMANIGPIIYTIYQKYSPKKFNDVLLIYIIYIIGCLNTILFAFFYDRTAYIGGVNHSIALFIFSFFFSIVGCTSSVLFMPYMGRFKEIYLITYLTGEGLSGFFTSIVALIQGIGGNPECIVNDLTITEYYPPARFGVREFFYFVFALIVLSYIAFILLDNLRMCKNEYAKVIINYGNKYQYDNDNDTIITENNILSNEDSGETIKNPETMTYKISTKQYNLLLLLMAIVCLFGNTFLNGIQTYSCLPYGNVAYHLSVTLGTMANPIACFLAIFLPHTSIKIVYTLISITGLLTIYLIYTALMSPEPPLMNMVIGEVIIVICWTLVFGFVGYIKLTITSIFRLQGGKSLVWIGVATQIGSFLGSLLSFCLVNVATDVFKSYVHCDK